MSADDILFECDFSIEELTVLADLLEVPALPGGDPDLELSDAVKAAAARGLLARGVVMPNGATGSVEITQPYASMISIVLLASEVAAVQGGTLLYQGEGAVVTAAESGASQISWRMHKCWPSWAGPPLFAAHREGTHMTIDPTRSTDREDVQ